MPEIKLTSKSTSDLYFAASMMSYGVPLESIDRSDPRHMVFTFVASNRMSEPATPDNPSPEPYASEVDVIDLDIMERDWVNGKLMVNATKNKEAMQRLKSIIHSH